jgi:TP901 family phage tail tape measure protein
MLNNMGLGFVFTARDLASGTMAGLERRFASLDERVSGGGERMTRAFHQIGLGLGMMTAGAVTVGGAFALANAAGTFEQSIAAVAAVSGATTNELELLRTAAIDAGIATQFSPTEATVGLRELAQAGFNAGESIDLLRPVLDLAAGSLGELTPQTAAGLAAQAMKAFGLGTDEASISVDRMLQAVNVFALSAGELPLALGTASRGAQTLSQSMSETLISLGLVKNVVPGVERASTAVAVSMERMADPDVQKSLRGMGIAVTDSQDRFRPFLDILGDLAGGLDRMSEAQRSAFLLQTFGREALGGLNAILTQVTTGIRTNTGETLKGAEAMGYLRDQFENAGGTAATFREKMLATFAGQGQLLRGSLETLAIVLGEPFAAVLKPVVTAVVDALNGLISLFRSMPAGVMRAFSTLVVASGALLALVGSVITAKAGIALLGIGLRALGLSLGSLLASVVPAILVVGALAAVIAGFTLAYRKNLGGLGDFTRRLSAEVQLFFNGLKQLFEGGGFSGAVRDELDRAENLGLKQFLLGLYEIAGLIGQVWDGLKQGFVRSIEGAQPVFAALSVSLSELGSEFRAIFTAIVGSAARLPSERFLSLGAMVGTAIGAMVSGLARLIAIGSRLGAGFLSGFRPMTEMLGPALATVRGAFADLSAMWRRLMGDSSDASEQASAATDRWRGYGEVVGKVVGGIATVLSLAWAGFLKVMTLSLWVAGTIKAAFVGLLTFFADPFTFLARLFVTELPKAVEISWNKIKTLAQPLVDLLRELWSFLESIARRGGSILGGILPGLPSFLQETIGRALGPQMTSSDSTDSGVFPLATSSSTMPTGIAASPAQAEATTRARQMASVFDFATQRRADSKSQTMPFVVNLQVDGETIARAVNKAEQSSASRGFSPVPVY